MRHELYADSRDVTKLSVIVHLAREHALNQILQVAMLTSDRGSGEGLHRQDPASADSTVRDFFLAERSSVRQSPSKDRLGRIKSLGPLMSPALAINVFDRRLIDRGYYFDDLAQRLARFDAPVLVFLDLDTGFAPPLSERHVLREELRKVFLDMPVGSVVAVFQYNRRESAQSCVAFAAASVKAALSGLAFTPIASNYSAPVAIVAAAKPH